MHKGQPFLAKEAFLREERELIMGRIYETDEFST